MRSPDFQFKQFSIWHDKTPMKVGTDGVLLGAWADTMDARAVLDIGTGTGLLALMIAQRNPECLISAIELNEAAVAQAQDNFNASPWRERLHCIHSSLQEFEPEATYDLIVCNPPYFEDSPFLEDKGRTQARVNKSLSVPEILAFGHSHLNPGGKCALVLPYIEPGNLTKLAQDHSMSVVRITAVHATPKRKNIRILVEISNTEEASMSESELMIEEFGRHQYSQAYIDLTKDFYLKM